MGRRRRVSVDGVVEASGVKVDGYRVDSVVAELAASPALAELRRTELRVLGGSLRGAGTVALTGAERAIEGRLEWSGLDPSTLPLDLPEAARGSLDGFLEVAGSVERPEGDLELRWVAGGASPLDAGSLRARLSGGEVQLASERLSTAAGPLAVTGRLPLGDLPRPAWLWPDAAGTRDLPQVMTAWGRIYRLLKDVFPAERYHFGRGVARNVDCRADRAIATFEDGAQEEGDLLVAADGIRSTVRMQLAPDVRPQYAGYVAWRGLIEERAFPAALRDEIFEDFVFGLPPHEQIVTYPVAGKDNTTRRGERRYDFVWYRPADETERLPCSPT